MLTVQALMLIAVIGAAVLGLWIAVRFPRLAPRRVLGVAAYLVSALAAMQLGSAAVATAAEVIDPRATVVLVVVPVFAYVFAAAAWVMIFFAGALRPFTH